LRVSRILQNQHLQQFEAKNGHVVLVAYNYYKSGEALEQLKQGDLSILPRLAEIIVRPSKHSPQNRRLLFLIDCGDYVCERPATWSRAQQCYMVDYLTVIDLNHSVHVTKLLDRAKTELLALFPRVLMDLVTKYYYGAVDKNESFQGFFRQDLHDLLWDPTDPRYNFMREYLPITRPGPE
jgi:hypothetical protein